MNEEVIMLKRFFVIFSIFCSFFLVSCTAEIEMTLKDNGEIEVRFEGMSDAAFSNLIKTASGMEEGDVVFDVNAITYELVKNGFLDVKVESKQGTDISISMIEKTGKTIFFDSGVIEKNKDELKIRLTPENVLEFYKKSDEQIKVFLDMLIAPIFNEEIMTEQEYLETVSSFYGESVSDELKDSKFRIILNQKKNKVLRELNISEILTLKEIIEIS